MGLLFVASVLHIVTMKYILGNGHQYEIIKTYYFRSVLWLSNPPPPTHPHPPRKIRNCDTGLQFTAYSMTQLLWFLIVIIRLIFVSNTKIRHHVTKTTLLHHINTLQLLSPYFSALSFNIGCPNRVYMSADVSQKFVTLCLYLCDRRNSSGLQDNSHCHTVLYK